MTELQSKLTEMLGFFHKLCEENDLRYYIIAGTLLGAVRHGGFIPWDDDIDVAMPREDYEKLRSMAPALETEQYRVEFPSADNKDYHYNMAKMYDKTTTLVEKKRYVVKKGAYLDIFPLEGLGNTVADAVAQVNAVKSSVNLYTAVTCAFIKRRSLVKNAAVLAGRLLCPLFIKEHKLVEKVEDICKKYTFEQSRYVCVLWGEAGVKGIMPKTYYGKPTKIRFENLEVYGVEKPDDYLNIVYGNYMTPPPENKRISVHDSIDCDLHKSYLE